MTEPDRTAAKGLKPKAEDFLTPASFIRAAKAADPAFRYALVVAGILAIVVTFVKFRVGYITLVFGAIAVIGLMVLYLVFAQASKLNRTRLDPAAQVLVWGILIITIAIVIFLTSSVFFNVPLPFRDWLIAQLPQKTKTIAPPSAGPAIDSDVAAEKAVILSELVDAYKATGWKLAFFDSWGHPPTLQLLRVKDGMLIASTVDGSRTVSLSVDPNQLPVPQHYKAYVGNISKLGSEQAPAVVRFFTAYDQFRDSLARMTSNPADPNGAFLEAHVDAREALNRGRVALCLLGSTPPRLFPEEPGGFPEPVPPNCSGGPFSH